METAETPLFIWPPLQPRPPAKLHEHFSILSKTTPEPRSPFSRLTNLGRLLTKTFLNDIQKELNEEEDINFFIIPIDNIFSPFSISLSSQWESPLT